MILKMKKAKLVVLKEEKDELLKSLQKYGVLMIIPETDGSGAVLDSKVEGQASDLERTERSLALLDKFKEKKPFVREIKIINHDDFINKTSDDLVHIEEVEKRENEILTIKEENEALKEEINFYIPWLELDIPLNQVKDTKETIVHTGFIGINRQVKFMEIMDKYQSLYKIMNEFSRSNSRSVILFNYHSDDKDVLEELRSIDFVDVDLGLEESTVSLLFREKTDLYNQNVRRIEELESELNDLASDTSGLELLNDQLASSRVLETTEVKQTLETAYIEGWLKADDEKKLVKAISEVTELYDLEIVDPIEGEIAPTATKNNKFVDSFESITNMFAMPSQDDIDPNPAMSVWFWIIFGMMMGDAVYGLLMIIVFGLLIKLKKPKGNTLRLYRMFFFSGFTTIVWGVIYGSYLGYEFNPIFSPMNDIQEFLILSLIIGGLHIITGILLKAYHCIINGDLVAAIVDNITWALIIAGIGLALVPAVSKVGLALIVAGLAIIILLGGRSKKGIFGKIFGGISSLTGIVNYASDILSYSRILALALSTAVIAMVMNLLAGMVLGIPIAGILLYLIVLFIGHVFNIGMGLLSAYVHDSRLQYIEFFGKFYEGGGYAFEPLSYKLNYIDKVDTNLEVS